MSALRTNLALLAILIILTLPDNADGQTPISGVVNDYASVQGIFGNNRVLVDDPSVFGLNDRALIIQMQGATIDTTNTSSFGAITDTGAAGLYEFNTVCAIKGDTLVFEYDFSNIYSNSGVVQVVRVPQYANANVSGTLSATPWNDSTGGIIAIEVSGTLSFSGNVDANGLGFQGGQYNSTLNCSPIGSYQDYFYALGSDDGLTKGHGVATLITDKESGKGPQANGGGGGNNHNSGGGGGAHSGAGGQGGENQDPEMFSCHGYDPGLGGLPLGSGSSRWFLGGGGGCGHGNNNDPGTVSSGGAGGGIVFIRADSLAGHGYQISARGNAGGYASNDGAGGGGAGGMVVLDVNNFHSSSLVLDVSGADGGDANNDGANRCFGPGGGGGGGAVLSTSTFPFQLLILTNGGLAGETINSTECTGTLGATNGGNGIQQTGISINESNVAGNGCSVLLPIEKINLWVAQQKYNQVLKWKLESPQAIDLYKIEMREEHHQVRILGQVEADQIWASEYQFELPNVSPGHYYLRLEAISGNNLSDYSHWLSWEVKGNTDLCQISPNPLSPDEFSTIDLTGFNNENITIEVFNSMGRLLQMNRTSPLKTHHLNFHNQGIYIVSISDGRSQCQEKVLVRP